MSGTITRVVVVNPETKESIPVETVLQAARDENQHVAFSPEGKIIVGDVHDMALGYVEMLMGAIKDKLMEDSLSGSETSEELAQGIASMGLEELARRVAIAALFGIHVEAEGESKEVKE